MQKIPTLKILNQLVSNLLEQQKFEGLLAYNYIPLFFCNFLLRNFDGQVNM